MKDLYHVIGFPIEHTLSPVIQMNLAKKYNQKILFTAIKVLPENLETKIQKFKNNYKVKGLSITTPYKNRVFELSDDADINAKIVKSASNVIFTPERKMIALNYDGIAIINDIKKNYKINFSGMKVLVIGVGGAAKAVVSAIIKESPLSLSITNRTYTKLEDMIKIFNVFNVNIKINIIDFNNIRDSFDIIINATSSSINGELLPLKNSNFNKNSFVYDLMYGANGTILTNWCKSRNIKAVDGKGMLNELSILVFKHWRGL